MLMDKIGQVSPHEKCVRIIRNFSLPEANIAPESGWLEY